MFLPIAINHAWQVLIPLRCVLSVYSSDLYRSHKVGPPTYI